MNFQDFLKISEDYSSYIPKVASTIARQCGRWIRPIWTSNQVTISESGTNDLVFAHLVNHLITAGY